MSFILKYLDEALDTVTGRYEGEEDTEEEDGEQDASHESAVLSEGEEAMKALSDIGNLSPVQGPGAGAEQTHEMSDDKPSSLVDAQEHQRASALEAASRGNDRRRVERDEALHILQEGQPGKQQEQIITRHSSVQTGREKLVHQATREARTPFRQTRPRLVALEANAAKERQRKAEAEMHGDHAGERGHEQRAQERQPERHRSNQAQDAEVEDDATTARNQQPNAESVSVEVAHRAKAAQVQRRRELQEVEERRGAEEGAREADRLRQLEEAEGKERREQARKDKEHERKDEHHRREEERRRGTEASDAHATAVARGEVVGAEANVAAASLGQQEESLDEAKESQASSGAEAARKVAQIGRIAQDRNRKQDHVADDRHAYLEPVTSYERADEMVSKTAEMQSGEGLLHRQLENAGRDVAERDRLEPVERARLGRARSSDLVSENGRLQKHADHVAIDAPMPSSLLSASVAASERERARQEAWAEARTLAEEKARTNALRAAECRARTEMDASDRVIRGADASASTPTPIEENGVGVRRAGKAETEHSQLGSRATDGAIFSPSAPVPAVHAKSNRWMGLLADRRKERTVIPSTSSVTSSQVSTMADSSLARSLAAGKAVPVGRASGPHDLSRLRSRTRRGNGGELGQDERDEPECAACLGLWDEGGSTLSRWYRCRKCGGVVHGACRQFFNAAEACMAGETSRDGMPPGWKTAVNCPGVVQVGVLQAFGLPLKPGESVYIALRLLPWKERVKTGSAKWGDLGASWPSHPSAKHDLLHLYNSDATPLPTLRVEVWRSAMRVLDDLLGFASIAMDPLLARPRSVSERWHVLSQPHVLAGGGKGSVGSGVRAAETNLSAPSAPAGTLLLSLGFYPTGGTPEVPVLGMILSSRDPDPEDILSPKVSTRGVRNANQRPPWSSTPEVPEVPKGIDLHERGEASAHRAEVSTSSRHMGDMRTLDSRPASAFAASESLADGDQSSAFEGGASGTDGERGGEAVTPFKSDEGRPNGGAHVVPAATKSSPSGVQGAVHLFRVKTFPSPAWCEVCQRLLLGVRNQGFCCEVCGMSVHERCQLRANFALSCRGRLSKGRGIAAEGNDARPSARAGAGAGAGADFQSSSSRMEEEGVGLIQIHLRSAHRCGSRCTGGQHSYLAVDNADKTPRRRRDGSGTYFTAAALAGTPEPGQRDGDGNFSREGGVISPGPRRWSGVSGDEGFFRGDHYCRVSVGLKGSPTSPLKEVRTEAVFQTRNPRFDRTWVFAAPSYDSKVAIDLVDASTDRSVGRFETTVIALLQEDYDARAVRRVPPSQQCGERRLLSPGAAEDENNVTGLLQVDENIEAFFGPSGILGGNSGQVIRKVPPRQKADLGVESLKALLARLKGILFWLKVAKTWYKHVMSWDNPALSSISLVTFVYLAVAGNTEYLLALGPFCLLLFMSWGFLSRRSGRYVEKWVTIARATGGTKLNTADFRSVAMLKVAVVQGRNLTSFDLDLPGNAYVRVTYIPSRKGAEGDAKPDDREYLVGQTAPCPTGPAPYWGRVGGGFSGSAGGSLGAAATAEYRGTGEFSGGSDALLQNLAEIWPREKSAEKSSANSLDGTVRTLRRRDLMVEEDLCFVYPVLEPAIGEDNGASAWPCGGSTGYLRFSLMFANPFNSLMDSYQGEVVVPLASLVADEVRGGTQPEVRGWFDVSPPAGDLKDPEPPRSSRSKPAFVKEDTVGGGYASIDTGSITLRDPQVRHGDRSLAQSLGRDPRRSSNVDGFDTSRGASETGALFLRLQMSIRDKTSPVTAEDVEKSRALQAMLGEARSADATAGGQRGSGGDAGGGSASGGSKVVTKEAASVAGGLAPAAVARLIGMPMGLWTTVKDVQDAINDVLDTLERVKQLLNWTHPQKTLLVYGSVALIWLILLAIPGRYIVLVIGLYEFSRVWIGVQPQAAETPAISIKIKNVLDSLPVDSELAACYAWEAGRFAKKEKADMKLREQKAKLKLLGAGRQWEGCMDVRDRPGDPWEQRYVLVLGHRVAWWGSSKDLDAGRKARGQLLLQGHAGVTHVSPTDTRDVSDPATLLCVFGRNLDGLPYKVSFMADTVAAKIALENAISSVVETKRD